MSARLLTDSGRCVTCGKAQFRVTTDGMGNAFDVADPCPCYLAATAPKPKRAHKDTSSWRTRIDRERRLACVCQLCNEPVVGKPKVALYCEGHREERRRPSPARKAKMRRYSRNWRKRNDLDAIRETRDPRARVRELEAKLARTAPPTKCAVHGGRMTPPTPDLLTLLSDVRSLLKAIER